MWKHNDETCSEDPGEKLEKGRGENEGYTLKTNWGGGHIICSLSCARRGLSDGMSMYQFQLDSLGGAGREFSRWSVIIEDACSSAEILARNWMNWHAPWMAPLVGQDWRGRWKVSNRLPERCAKPSLRGTRPQNRPHENISARIARAKLPGAKLVKIF